MSLELVLAVYGIAILFTVAGALFINRISGRAIPIKSLAAKPFKILFSPLYIPKVTVAFIFVAIGIAFILLAPFYITYSQTTGYRYVLELQKSPLRYIDQSCVQGTFGELFCSFVDRLTLDRAVIDAKLLEYPTTTYYTVLLFRPDYVLFGLAFTIIGCILAAYFLARANTAVAKQLGVWIERPE
jgi:hypothetical protein